LIVQKVSGLLTHALNDPQMGQVGGAVAMLKNVVQCGVGRGVGGLEHVVSNKFTSSVVESLKSLL